MRMHSWWPAILLAVASGIGGCGGSESKEADALADVMDAGDVAGEADVGTDRAEPTDVPETEVGADVTGDAEDGGDGDAGTGPLKECPAGQPLAGTECVGEFACEYGEECCCGECFAAVNCSCGGGQMACMALDMCLGAWCEIPPCCAAGDDAGCDAVIPGNVCVADPGEEYGKCLPPAAHPLCWNDVGCQDGEVCKGAFACMCNAMCDDVDAPGMCLPADLPEGCCESEAHCAIGANCVQTVPGEPGLCLPLVEPGKCWQGSDCGEGQVCQGATFCPCGMECGQVQAPGKCASELAAVGCVSDQECAAGEECVGDEVYCSEDPLDPEGCVVSVGVCLEIPDLGLCWEDADCSLGLVDVCVNPVYCRAGAVCLVDEHEGVCLNAADGGCWTDLDCGAWEGAGKLACTGEWVIPWWTGNDYDAEPDFTGECCYLAEGDCYEDDDCLASQVCEGAVYPYLGACTDDADDEKPGTCVDAAVWPEELCVLDTDCAAGQYCIGEWTCPVGVACMDPAYPGLCLEPPVGALLYCYETMLDCPQGMSCQGAWVCDVVGGEMCGGLMAAPGECQPEEEGGDVGDTCGESGGTCKAGLVCCYPCGIPDCDWVCQEPCNETDPGCVDGCLMVP